MKVKDILDLIWNISESMKIIEENKGIEDINPFIAQDNEQFEKTILQCWDFIRDVEIGEKYGNK